MIFKILCYWLLAVNLYAFILWCTDKLLAKRQKRRISEKHLFLSALLGGSVGAIAAMYTVRHKTLHKRFTIGLPAILVLQIALAAGIVYLLN